MVIETAIGLALGGQALGTLIGADATGRAAGAQLGQQRADRALALSYAEATPEELRNLQQSIAFSEGDIARKTKLLESVNPALIEAGQQALALLQGKEAASLAPLKTQIAKQEGKLRERLAAQLGSGYENTTAGLQALQAFNEQANTALAGAQQQTLGSLLGTSTQSYGLASNLNVQQQLAGMQGAIQNRKISALQGTPVDPGLQYAGQAALGRGIAGAASNLGQAAVLGSLLGGGGSSPFASGKVSAQVMSPDYQLGDLSRPASGFYNFGGK